MTLDDLTARERQIVKLLAKGYPYKRIAEEIGIAQPTVKNITTRAIARCGIKRGGQAKWKLLLKFYKLVPR